MSHAELTRNFNNSAVLTIAIISVGTSMMAARPSCQATTPINASDPTTTPSSMEAATRDLRILGISTPLSATYTKPGAKMPTVATTAPGTPPMMYPMNVAYVITGPGVT